MLTSALKAAVRSDMLRKSPADRVTNKPRMPSSEDALHNVWSAEEARRFLTALKQSESVQDAALFGVALDAGVRIGELLALQWKDLDLVSGGMKVERQRLLTGSITLPKGKRARVVDLSEETLCLLREHKREQTQHPGQRTEPLVGARTVREVVQGGEPEAHHHTRPAPHLRHTAVVGGCCSARRTVGHKSISITLDTYGSRPAGDAARGGQATG